MKVRLLPILLVWFGLSISLVLAADTAEKAAAGAAQTWLGQIDAGNYGKSWKDAASYFQGAISEKGWNRRSHRRAQTFGAISVEETQQRAKHQIPSRCSGRQLRGHAVRYKFQ